LDEITLRLREPTTIPIEADSICPDHFVGRSRAEIEALPAFYGRRKVTLGDLFIVEGENSDSIIVEGDLRHVKKIGQRMTRGRITVRGDVGLHLGAYTSGGEITVEGNAGDWAGAHMQGGRLWIKGNAGHLLGAAYRGEKRGVNRGVIVVEGDAGRETGAQMRRGLIVVLGDVGEFAGARMIAGSIFVFGRLGARAGAGMKRGTIVAFGDHAELLPTFRYECRFQPVFLRHYLLRLREWKIPIRDEYLEGSYRRYHGDITTLGKGEILIHDQRQ
jgi:formylmethanofuran dehydrogenase subunit C